jgi:hypothetical protein
MTLIHPLHQQPDEPGEDAGEGREGKRHPAGMFALEFRDRNIVMNAGRLKNKHEEKGDNESNGGPLQTPQEKHVRVKFSAFTRPIQSRNLASPRVEAVKRRRMPSAQQQVRVEKTALPSSRYQVRSRSWPSRRGVERSI